MWVQNVWETLVANVEGEGDYAGWGLWDDGTRRFSIEEGRDTKRRVAAIWDYGSEVATAATGKLTKTRKVISGSEQRCE